MSSPHLDPLRERWPTWSIWASDAGRLYAGRRTPKYLPDLVFRFGVAMTVHAPTPVKLDRELTAQAEYEQQARAALRLREGQFT
jgi:hypothetical protein